MWRTLVLLVGIALFSSGCFSQATQYAVPRHTARRCARHCSGLGMRLGAVVIIMNSAGCVCERGQLGKAVRSGAAAVAGGMMIHATRAQQRRSSRRSSN